MKAFLDDRQRAHDPQHFMANGTRLPSPEVPARVDILKAGGSAVDAAIAANAALGLMEPTGNGIGGDLFAIVYDPETGELHGLNASGRSPQGLTLDELKEEIGDRDGL
ncbi:MAG: gamma-glutamyltransferase, partial [Desulfococcaceae bacterium]